MSAFLIYFCNRGSLIWTLYNTYKGQKQWEGLPCSPQWLKHCASWCICRGKSGWSETLFLTWLGPVFCVPVSSNLFCGAGWNVTELLIPHHLTFLSTLLCMIEGMSLIYLFHIGKFKEMRWEFLVMYLSWRLLVWGPEDPLISETLIVYCMSPEKGRIKMQCLGAASLSAQGVAPTVCWSCCEKPPAPNWETRRSSGQVVLSSPGQLTAPWRLALVKILKRIVIFYTDSCPIPNPFCDVLILELSHPVPFLGGMPSASGTAQIFQWVLVKRAGCWSPTESQAESVKQLISMCFSVHLPSLTPHISLCFYLTSPQ